MKPGDEAREFLAKEAEYPARELAIDTPHELAEKLFNYEGFIGCADKAIHMLRMCGYTVEPNN